MTTTTTAFTPIDTITAPRLDETPAAALRRIRDEAPAFREWFRETGEVTAFASRDLVTLPYPRQYGLWEACRARTKYVWMTNRCFVIQWEQDGRTKTLIAEPSDYELGIETPYLRHAVDRLPISEERARKLLFTEHKTVLRHCADLGIDPAAVDYLVFDHLHTQDIRRLVGTADGSIAPMFPNARMIVQQVELDHVRDVHPFQARFHQSWTYAGVDTSKLLVVDGSVLVAPGLALVRTPGHTLGNHTIVVNAPGRGILTSSENGIAVESYAPQFSRLPGVREYAAEWGYEVILNYNTPEWASWQYNSMVAEKLIADSIPERPHLPQVVPSSELTTHRLARGVKPLYEHGQLTLGALA
jgi:hypothetical protein